MHSVPAHGKKFKDAENVAKDLNESCLLFLNFSKEK